MIAVSRRDVAIEFLRRPTSQRRTILKQLGITEDVDDVTGLTEVRTRGLIPELAAALGLENPLPAEKDPITHSEAMKKMAALQAAVEDLRLNLSPPGKAYERLWRISESVEALEWYVRQEVTQKEESHD